MDGTDLPPAGGGAADREPPVSVSSSRGFAAWLASTRTALAFSTYQVGKVFVVGVNDRGALSITERTFPRCMGLCADGEDLWLSSLWQIWRLSNVVPPGQTQNGYDRLYVPQEATTTGDIDIHDMAVDADGRLLFAAAAFGCLATTDSRYNFKALWKPPFLSRLAQEDRCHLNGLALDSGRPRYVTAVSTTDVAGGWREHKRDGGVVVDIASGEIVCAGLSMPHSPRLHDGRLWLHNSGTGEFGWVDVERGRFEPVAFLPGFLRGLAFVGGRAVAGLSQARHDKTFSGLALDDALARHGVAARCGLAVIDLTRGDMVEWLEIAGVIHELYDVTALPGTRRPTLLGVKADDIRRTIRFTEGRL
jgi:uncharacterized protein (TIGR03032 family)